MLSPKLCGCGCLQPLFEGNSIYDGVLKNHMPSRRVPNTPSFLVIDTGYKSPCWVWQGATNKWGYAKLKRSGKTHAGHRFFYKAYIDPELPSSKSGKDGLDHLCRIRKCVNPMHLDPVTCAENIRRGSTSKLSPEQVNTIRMRALSGENQRNIAKNFDIQQNQVSRIKTGTRWSTSMMN